MHDFTVQHIVVPSNQPYEHIVQRIEVQLGLILNWDAMAQQLRSANAPWEQVSQVTEKVVGTSGFLIFSKIDTGALLSLTGKPKKVLQYTLGNPLIAVQMIEQVPEVGLYVPLRLIVYEDYEGKAFVAYDQPSSLLDQYHHKGVTSVAQLLDQKLAELVSQAIGN